MDACLYELELDSGGSECLSSVGMPSPLPFPPLSPLRSTHTYTTGASQFPAQGQVAGMAAAAGMGVAELPVPEPEVPEQVGAEPAGLGSSLDVVSSPVQAQQQGPPAPSFQLPHQSAASGALLPNEVAPAGLLTGHGAAAGGDVGKVMATADSSSSSAVSTPRAQVLPGHQPAAALSPTTAAFVGAAFAARDTEVAEHAAQPRAVLDTSLKDAAAATSRWVLPWCCHCYQ